MADASETSVGEAGLIGRPDQVSVGVLVAAVPRFKVDEAAAVCGIVEQRRGGKLPPHVTAYLTMALCLFAEDSAGPCCVEGWHDRGDLSGEGLGSFSPLAAAEVGIRRLPGPARGDRDLDPLVSAVQPVLSGR
jgi:hypothetical protein